MNEHSFARRLSSSLRSQGAYVWKINANFAGGVPDMWVAGNGLDLWLELKWIRAAPKRASTILKPALSAQQENWLTDRYLQGVRVMVVLATPDGCYLFNTPDEWGTGVRFGELCERRITHKDVGFLLGRLVGLGALNAKPTAESAYKRTDCNREEAERHLVTKKGRAQTYSGRSSRKDGHNSRQLHAVPQPAHSGKHRLRTGLLPRTGR